MLRGSCHDDVNQKEKIMMPPRKLRSDDDVENSNGRDSGAKLFYKMSDILDCFLRTKGDLSITDIVDATNFPRTTVHRIVTSLRDIGLVDQDGRRQNYRLGLKMFHFGSVVIANLELNRHARPHILALHQLTGEIVHLNVFDGSQMACIEREEMDETRLTTLTTIESAPVHCTSVGKAFLAFQDPTLISRIAAEGLEVRTEKTLATEDALNAELARVRKDGYAIDDEENQIGVRCVGAPIHDSRGQVFAAISVSGPSNRMPVTRLHGMASAIIQAATAVSESLGWDGH